MQEIYKILDICTKNYREFVVVVVEPSALADIRYGNNTENAVSLKNSQIGAVYSKIQCNIRLVKKEDKFNHSDNTRRYLNSLFDTNFAN